MVAVVILRAWVVVDFFANELWYDRLHLYLGLRNRVNLTSTGFSILWTACMNRSASTTYMDSQA
jgi:hypothetical protein